MIDEKSNNPERLTKIKSTLTNLKSDLDLIKKVNIFLKFFIYNQGFNSKH